MSERLSRRRFTAIAASLATATAGCSNPRDDGAGGDATETPEDGETPADGEASIGVDEDAEVYFEAPEDGAAAANGVTVSMAAENFTIEEAGEVNDNAGHFHVLVDEEPVEAGEEIPDDDTHLHFGDGSSRTVLDLEPAAHELTLQAADGEHRALDLTDTVEVEVDGASVSWTAPEDGATVESPVAAEFDASDNVDVEEAGELSQTGGHFHVLVDEEPVEVGEEMPDDDTHLHFGDGATEAELDLEAGEHTLVLQMGDGEHLALPETDEVTVTVE